MLNYDELKKKPRNFLSATGLTMEEFEILLEDFRRVYELTYPPHLTIEGKERKRRVGGGNTGKLGRYEEKLLFILIYQKTNPLQTMHGLQFELSQSQTNYWIHRLLPILQEALSEMGMKPEREGTRVGYNSETLEGGGTLSIDGTERRLQRPTDRVKQNENYSGKKKTHTDKNLILINEINRKVIYLSPTCPGKMHDKKIGDEVAINYPRGTTLDKDTGFQGYEPEGIITNQPQKNRKVKS